MYVYTCVYIHRYVIVMYVRTCTYVCVFIVLHVYTHSICTYVCVCVGQEECGAKKEETGL